MEIHAEKRAVPPRTVAAALLAGALAAGCASAPHSGQEGRAAAPRTQSSEQSWDEFLEELRQRREAYEATFGREDEPEDEERASADSGGAAARATDDRFLILPEDAARGEERTQRHLFERGVYLTGNGAIKPIPDTSEAVFTEGADQAPVMPAAGELGDDEARPVVIRLDPASDGS